MQSTLLFGIKMCLVILLLAAGVSLGAQNANTASQTRAVSALEEDVKKDPGNAELWLHLGFAYRKVNEIDQAQNAFEKVTSLNPNAKDAYFMLGLIYESKKLNPEAEKAWKSYLAIENDAERRAIAEKHVHHLNQ